MRINPPGSGDIVGIKSDGTPATFTEGVGCTLVQGGTYYFPVGDPNSPLPTEASQISAHCMWDFAGSLAITISIETSNFPKFLRDVRHDPSGPTDTLDTDTTAGKWIKQDPPGQYVPGSGFTQANLTLTTTAAGGAEYDLSQFASKRMHIKAVVAGGSGSTVLRVNAAGKAGR
jgi:hypothetical protein